MQTATPAPHAATPPLASDPVGQAVPPPPHGRALWPDVSLAQWSDWRWQQAHRIRTRAQLEKLLPLTDDERAACDRATGKPPSDSASPWPSSSPWS